MPGLTLSTNADQVIADVGSYIDKVQSVAMPRAINKLIEQAQVAGFRKVNDIYGIGPRAFEQYASVSLAKEGRDFAATINVKGKGLPLVLFKPRKVKGGVSVLVKGRRFTIRHAFLATMNNGHTGVFARGAYGGKGKRVVPTGETFGRFVFGRTRLSVNELYTFSPPKAFSNVDVIEAMEDRVREQSSKVINQEIRFATR